MRSPAEDTPLFHGLRRHGFSERRLLQIPVILFQVGLSGSFIGKDIATFVFFDVRMAPHPDKGDPVKGTQIQQPLPEIGVKRLFP